MKLSVAFLMSMFWEFLLPSWCFGQVHKQERFYSESVSIHFDELDGLPSSNVYSVVSDRDGFLWLSTDEGVCRYDGASFKCFDMEDGLSDNEIFSMYEDSYGRLWFLTYNGLLSFHYKGRFYNSGNLPELARIRPGNFLSTMFEDRNHDLYLGTKNGLVYLIANDGNISEFDRFSGGSIYSIFRGRNNRLEISYASHRVAIYEEGRRELLTLGDSVFRFPPRIIRLSDGMCLVGNGASLHKGDVEGTWDKVDFDPGQEQLAILFLSEEKGGRTWVCTTKGAFFSDKDGPWRRVMSGTYVSSVTKDIEGGYWFSTNRGLYYFPDFDVSLFSMQSKSNEAGKSVTALMNYRDSVLFVGREGGVIQKIDIKTRTNLGSLNIPLPRNRGQGVIHRIQDAGPKGVLVSTDFGFFQIEQSKISQCKLSNIKSALPITGGLYCLCHTFGWNIVKTLECDSISSMMVASTSGNSRERCYDVGGGSAGELIVATSEGIRTLRISDSVIMVSDPLRIGPARPTRIARLASNLYLIGTSGDGLFLLKNGNAMKVGMKSTGALGTVNAIEVQGDTVAYLATNEGFCRLAYSRNVVDRQFFNGYLWGKSRIRDIVSIGGTIFAATEQGLLTFDDSLFFKGIPNPVPLIEWVKVNSRPRPIGNGIVTNFQENSISIGFVGLAFRPLGEIEFRYRLLGADSSWSYTSNRAVEYPELRPGNYDFQVQSRAYGDKEYSRYAKLKIQILTPFWRTSWFMMLVVVVAGLLVILSLIIRIQILKQRNEIERRAIEAEQKLLSVQMNPHFIFNALNSMQGYFFLGELERYNEYLGSLSDMIRTILVHSRESSVSLKEEYDFLQKYLELQCLRMNRSFEYEVKVVGLLDLAEFRLPPMLTQPFVENAVLHGISSLKSEGRILVQLGVVGKTLRCVIEDNGIGRERAREYVKSRNPEHKSVAMGITKERIEILNKAKNLGIEFTIEDSNPLNIDRPGTRVTLTFGRTMT